MRMAKFVFNVRDNVFGPMWVSIVGINNEVSVAIALLLVFEVSKDVEDVWS